MIGDVGKQDSRLGTPLVRRLFDNRKKRQEIIETIMFGIKRKKIKEEQEAEQGSQYPRDAV